MNTTGPPGPPSFATGMTVCPGPMGQLARRFPISPSLLADLAYQSVIHGVKALTQPASAHSRYDTPALASIIRAAPS